MINMQEQDQVAVARLLTYSWRDINYQYASLTPGEKACLTPEQFVRLDTWRASKMLDSKDGAK